MAKRKWNWRKRFHDRLFIDLEEYLDEDLYLRIEYLTHREVRFLFAGSEVWFSKQKGYCTQIRPEHRTSLPFAQYAFLHCLGEALMAARWRSYKKVARQAVEGKVTHPRFHCVGRAHVTFRTGSMELSYHRDRGWQLDNEARSILLPAELATYEKVALCALAAVEQALEVREAERIKRQQELAAKRLLRKDPQQGLLDIF